MMHLPSPPLVSADWLSGHLGDVRVIDIRGKVLPAGTVGPRYFAKRDDYNRSHIPGALFVDWTTDIVDPNDPIASQIAPPAKFESLMTALAIGTADKTPFVAYDDYNTIFASRFVWALRYYGHDTARVLDGGWARWVRDGRPTEDHPPSPPRPVGPFTARARPLLRRTADEVAARLGHDDLLLIDARPPAQFAGNVSAAARAGHIPGARNVPYTSLIDQTTGELLALPELRKSFAKSGVDVDALPREIVCYCNGGITATVPLTALHAFGRSDVAVYDGSWNEWGNDPNRPIERGERGETENT